MKFDLRITTFVNLFIWHNSVGFYVKFRVWPHVYMLDYDTWEACYIFDNKLSWRIKYFRLQVKNSKMKLIYCMLIYFIIIGF